MRKSNLSNYTHSLWGTVPKNWKWYRINEICTISSGGTPSRKEKDNFKGNILWVTSGELKNRTIEDTLEKISDGAVEEFNLTLYDPETVIIAIYGLEAEGVRGTASILKKKSTISQACMAFANFQGLSNVYFYYWYLNYGSIIGKRYAQGTKQQNLSQDVVATIPICCPPLPEQQKIAAILSTQDKVIELKEKLLVQKQQQKKYLMQQLLTGKKRLPGFNGEWQFAKLENVSKYSASAASFKTYESHLGCGPYPVYDATGCFGNIDFYENEQPYISIVKDGAGAGRVALCKAKSSTIGTLGCIFANDIDLLYLFYWMSAVDFQIYSNGSTIPHVYYKDYKNVQVHLPCRLEQEAIVEILSTADHEIDLLQKSIEAEKQKKKALMQLLLTGKVSVQI